MLSLAANMRIWLCTTPTDMRKSFDGLNRWTIVSKPGLFTRPVVSFQLPVRIGRK
jgi:hypothetical protein